MNGSIAPQMMENIPWNAEGVRHAHVDVGQLAVPSVIPAAIKAPILNRGSTRSMKKGLYRQRTSRSCSMYLLPTYAISKRMSRTITQWRRSHWSGRKQVSFGEKVKIWICI